MPPQPVDAIDLALTVLNDGRPAAGQARLTGAGNLALRQVEDFDPAGLTARIHDLRRSRERLAEKGLLPRAPLPRQPARRLALHTDVPLG